MELNIYKTANLHLAVFLKVRGLRFLFIEENIENPSTCDFVFELNEAINLKTLLDQFSEDTLLKDALFQYKCLKSELKKFLTNKHSNG